MTIYCIDDGGDGTQTNTTQISSSLTWSKAHVSVAALIAYDAAAFTTSGNVIYFGDDTNDPNKAANWTLTGPTSGRPVILISADRTQATPTDKVGTGNQLSSLGGAFSATLDGAFALYGMRVASGANIVLGPDTNEVVDFCLGRLVPAANGSVSLGGANGARATCRDSVIDLTADGTTPRASPVFSVAASGSYRLRNLTFVNPAYRQGAIIGGVSLAAVLDADGCDFSGFVNTGGSECEIVDSTTVCGRVVLNNCKVKASYVLSLLTGALNAAISANLIGSTVDQTVALYAEISGGSVSTASIYRTGGAVFGTADTPASWLITTTASCSESSPFYTPWNYGAITATGSKTFDVYVSNDTADFTDAEVWIEVEYHATANDPRWTLASDQRATITTTAAVQTDDTTSTWAGTGPAYTYKQKLSVTATVNQVGTYRWRVVCGVTSLASSRYFYVDPVCTVT